MFLLIRLVASRLSWASLTVSFIFYIKSRTLCGVEDGSLQSGFIRFKMSLAWWLQRNVTREKHVEIGGNLHS